MRRLHWNTTLELAAQAWTEGCDFQHNYGTDYGENLSAQPYFYNGSEALLGWYSEIAYYDYTTNSCSDGHICGHYTQLVLEESSNVGCGIYFCRTMKTITMTNGYFIACFYSPATNKGSSVPYKNGPVCSSCLAGLGCVDGLCDEESPMKVKDPKCPSLVGFPKVLFVSGSQLCREVKSNQTETATTP
ncbi:glioma pathogenesis-related protein 1-like [Liolophura sinensis]|uniref:glioma pathogenesis-related protein 1-like n=1 Tax=Liolophura sinensis TaxID=3198878 RepID=UPI0031595F11